MKWTANEHLGKNNKPPFVLLAKQSKHLILFPNKCDDSRTRVTRDLMEQKFSAPLRGEQMGHETAGATASKAPESQNLTSVIAQEWKQPPPGEMKLELLSQQSRDRSSGTAASSQLSVCKLNFNTFITPAQHKWNGFSMESLLDCISPTVVLSRARAAPAHPAGFGTFPAAWVGHFQLHFCWAPPGKQSWESPRAHREPELCCCWALQDRKSDFIVLDTPSLISS